MNINRLIKIYPYIKEKNIYSTEEKIRTLLILPRYLLLKEKNYIARIHFR